MKGDIGATVCLEKEVSALDNGPYKENGVWRIPVRIVKKGDAEPELELSNESKQQIESLYGTSIPDSNVEEPPPLAEPGTEPVPETGEPTNEPSEPAAKVTRISADNDKVLKALAQAQFQNEQLTKDLERLRSKTKETVKQRVWQAKVSFIKSWLAVADTVDRAIFSLENDGDESTHADGFRGLREQINALLTSSGVEEIKAKGETFDPNFHEAVGAIPVPGEAEGTVYDVVERGFMLEGTLLRPAKVITVR